MTSTEHTEQTVETVRTFTILDNRLADAQAMVEKINRRAARYGLTGYTLEIGERIEVPIYARPEVAEVAGGFSAGIYMGAVEPEPIGYRYDREVTVHGEMPKINGWTFVASLDYSEEGGVITRPVPGVEVDLSAHRARANECDQCGTKRERNATYVLVDENGRTMQVGSSCIVPFIGLSVAAMAWLDSDPAEPGMREFSGGRAEPETFSVETILRVTMGICQVEGWVSVGVANEYSKIATKNLVMDYIDPRTDKMRAWAKRIGDMIDWQAAQDKAEKVRAWAIAQTGTSEWANNLRTLAGQERIGYRNIGLLCSAIAGYDREMGEKVKREARTPAEYVGKVGDKIDISGEVVTTYAYETAYGMSELIIIRAEGALYKWNSSRTTEFEAGDHVEGRATVKAHQEYKGDKQTVVTRAKLVSPGKVIVPGRKWQDD